MEAARNRLEYILSAPRAEGLSAAGDIGDFLPMRAATSPEPVAGHGHDHHGDGDDDLVVLGRGLVGADAASVFGEPAEGAFHDPASRDDD